MKIYPQLASFLLLFLMACHHSSYYSNQNRASSKQIKAGAEIFLQDLPKEAHVGIKIVSLRDGRTLTSHQENQLFTPASILKVFTAAATLHYLGPHHRFSTTLTTNSHSRKTGNIGHLYLKGYGDPGFSTQDLASMVAEFKQLGIQEISGNIYIDDTYFDDLRWGHGWMWDDRDRGYSAPISAVNLDHNRLVVKIDPAFYKGQAAHVLLFPKTNYIKISNKAKTVLSHKRKWISTTIKHKNTDGFAAKNPQEGLGYQDTVSLSGLVPLNSSSRYKIFAIKSPSQYVGYTLKEKMREAGIRVRGKVLKGTKPKDALVLVEHFSVPLSQTLIQDMKHSNNHAHECFVKAIAVQRFGGPGTFNNGLKAIQEFLAKEVGINPKSIKLSDGSGSSRYSLISPSHAVKMLEYIYHQFALSPELMAALPLSGLDGGLRNRLDNTGGLIRAKTGSLTGVANLIGYLKHKSGEVFAFAILTNGFLSQGSKVKGLVDEFLTKFVEKNTDKYSAQPPS